MSPLLSDDTDTNKGFGAVNTKSVFNPYPGLEALLDCLGGACLKCPLMLDAWSRKRARRFYSAKSLVFWRRTAPGPARSHRVVAPSLNLILSFLLQTLHWPEISFGPSNSVSQFLH